MCDGERWMHSILKPESALFASQGLTAQRGRCKKVPRRAFSGDRLRVGASVMVCTLRKGFRVAEAGVSTLP